jgi:hypothetical protein
MIKASRSQKESQIIITWLGMCAEGVCNSGSTSSPVISLQKSAKESVKTISPLLLFDSHPPRFNECVSH